MMRSDYIAVLDELVHGAGWCRWRETEWKQMIRLPKNDTLLASTLQVDCTAAISLMKRCKLALLLWLGLGLIHSGVKPMTGGKMYNSHIQSELWLVMEADLGGGNI